MESLTPAPNVLIVDDDKGLARLIEKAVRRIGISTAIALSGEETIAWLKNHRAELMLLDLKLPDYHGPALLDRLAAISCEVPFIIITGQGDERVAVDMMKRGALDYLVKDVQFLEFLPAVVQRSLKQLEREKRLAAAENDRKRLEQEILAISDREQRRVGQDLHDGLCQMLSGIDCLTLVLQKRLAQNSVGDADAAATISRYVRQAIEQARMLARGLSPVEAETNGLMCGLKELAQHVSALFKVSCEFRCDEPVMVEDHAKATHLYRIVQEAINNAVKHGKAKRIEITASHDGDRVVLSVSDDGSGIQEKPGEDNSGMGLRTMRYRANLVGAQLEILRVKPRGTSVICSFAAEPLLQVPQNPPPAMSLGEADLQIAVASDA